MLAINSVLFVLNVLYMSNLGPEFRENEQQVGQGPLIRT